MAYPTLPLAVYEDYARVKQIDDSQESVSDVRHVTDMLRRASVRVEQFTHRRFHPSYQTRRLNVPSIYADLNNRLLFRDDLWLDEDLLSPVRVQITSNVANATGDTLQANITAKTSYLTVLDADGLDSGGDTRFSVGDILLVDDEVMIVASVDTVNNYVYVRRGQLDTPTVSHTSSAIVYKYTTQTLNAGTDYVLLDYNVYPKYGLRLAYPNTWMGNYYSQTWGIPTILVTGIWGYHRNVDEGWVNSLDTLQAGIDDSTQTLTVLDADGTDLNQRTRFEVNRLIRVDDEYMLITAIDTDTNELTVLRGVNGTFAVAHDSSTEIDVWYPVDDIVDATLSIAKMLYESSQTTGGRMGVSEMSQGVELTMPQDSQQILKHYRKGIW
jgi:hypothetical protein